MTFTIDHNSVGYPGWPPFMDWLRAHGLDPREVKAVTVDPDTLTGTVTRYRTILGEKRADRSGNPITYETDVRWESAPPRWNA